MCSLAHAGVRTLGPIVRFNRPSDTKILSCEYFRILEVMPLITLSSSVNVVLNGILALSPDGVETVFFITVYIFGGVFMFQYFLQQF